MALTGHTQIQQSVAEEVVMEKTSGFNRRRFFASCSGTVAASTSGFPGFFF
jgi:hypothetical protein